MAVFSFHSEERLKSQQTIGRLFSEGASFSVFPLRVVWLPLEKTGEKYPAQFAVTVPKRSFRKAVQRNRLRRKIREAYRLQKGDFYQQLPPLFQNGSQQLALMIIYIAKEPLPYAPIDTAMKKLLGRLVRKVESRG